MYCPVNHDCYIQCKANYACQGARFYCPLNNTCDVQCPGYYGCSGSKFNQLPQDPSLLNLVWTGNRAMSFASYPPYPYNDITNYQNLTLICSNGQQCRYMTLTCPQYAYCKVYCESGGWGTCKEVCI